MNFRPALLLLAFGALRLSAADSAALTLEQCLEQAAAHHPALAAANAGVSAAGEAVEESRAPFYPQADLNAGYHRFQKRAFLPTGLSLPGRSIPELIGPLSDWTGGVSSRWTLYDFGERRSGLDAASARRAAAKADAGATLADVRLGVQTAFFSLATALDIQAVAERNLARTGQHLRMAEIRRQNGGAALADVLRLQAEQAAAQLQLLNSRSGVRIATGRLNTAMGRAADIPLAITLPPVTQDLALPDLSAGLARALAQRPELESASQRTAAARAAVTAARAARTPKLRADGSFGWNDTAWLPGTREWQAGLSIDVPLFDGGARVSRVARSRSELAREEASLENRRLQIRQEVWAAASELERARDSIAANETNVHAGTESLRAVQERYQAGAAVITDLLDTQTALARAEASLAAARWELLSARAAYERAIGAQQ